MTVWTLLVPAALFFFGAGMLFPLATSGAMEPFPFLAGTAGALVGGLQNIGSGVLAAVGDDAANRSGQPRPADDADGPVDSAVLAAAGLALYPPSAAGISAAAVPGWRLTPYPGYRTGRLPARASAVPSFCRVAAHALPGLPNNSEG